MRNQIPIRHWLHQVGRQRKGTAEIQPWTKRNYILKLFPIQTTESSLCLNTRALPHQLGQASAMYTQKLAFPSWTTSFSIRMSTNMRTGLSYSYDILVTKKDLLQPCSTLWELYSLPSQVHFAWHFYLCETGITLCAQAHCHPNTWARLHAVKRPTWEHPICFLKAQVWLKNVSSCSQGPVPIWEKLYLKARLIWALP